jgi:DNA-directed RNA polymerase subunit RPC12/RpoP
MQDLPGQQFAFSPPEGPLSLWQRLPHRFLKLKYPAWRRLDYAVQLLIVELASKQKFRCVHCSRDRNLEIEHDHDPTHGPGDRYTIYNIRGLACRGCNWRIMLYEKEKAGDYIGFDNVYHRLRDDQYEGYIYEYECRVSPLLEDLLQERLGVHNYWYRRNLLWKFDEWRYEWEPTYPWHWGFEEIKERRHGKIRTPKRFMKVLAALMRFVVDEFEKDANYQPPNQFIDPMVRLKPIFDSIRPTVDAMGEA